MTTQIPFVVPDWKDFECDYCRSLVMSCATRNVPEWAIRSYLDTQIASARKDRRTDALAYLESLRVYWINSARGIAAATNE